MSRPSDKALAAAWSNAEIEHTGQANIDRAIRAAHDPALRLDRSVCLRDVVEALRYSVKGQGTGEGWAVMAADAHAAADFIEREFGGAEGER